jgi:hypothetical protein
MLVSVIPKRSKSALILAFFSFAITIFFKRALNRSNRAVSLERQSAASKCTSPIINGSQFSHVLRRASETQRESSLRWQAPLSKYVRLQHPTHMRLSSKPQIKISRSFYPLIATPTNYLNEFLHAPDTNCIGRLDIHRFTLSSTSKKTAERIVIAKPAENRNE